MVLYVIFFFFFFQAEDGIRDYKVTGVQTCALPIARKSLLPRLLTGIPHLRLVHWWSAAARHRSSFSLVRNFGDEGFRCEHQGRDGGSVLKGRTGHLGRIENTGRDHVGIVFGFGIESEVWLFRLANFAHNDRTFVAGVGNDQPDGLFESTLHYSYADLLVAFELQLFKSRNRAQECDSTARYDTFVHSSTGRMHRVFDARLLLLHFRLGRRADLDDRHTADELRQPLLQLFAIIVGSRLFDLNSNLFHAPFYGRTLAAAFDDGGVVLVDDDLFRRTEILNLDVLQLNAEIFCDRTALSEGCDIVQHRLPAIAKARSFHGRRLQRAPQLVHNECCERFTFDVFSDNQQGAPHLRHLFQDRQKVFHRADLFFHNQDEAIFQYTLHPVRVGHKVRRQITTIELHPFDQVHRGLESLCFFDRDDAIFADFLHHLGAHILEGIFQLDFFRDRNAVFRDQRRTKLLVENHIAALRPQRDLHCISKYVNAPQDCLAGIFTVNDLFRHLAATFLFLAGCFTGLGQNANDLVLA